MAANKSYKIVKIGDPLLNRVCEKVQFPLSQQVDNSVADCIDTLRNIEGFWYRKALAMSAPQTGALHRFFIMCDRTYWYHPKLMYKKFITFYNPDILEFSDDKIEAWEGCVSNDQQIALVERPKKIRVQFNNIKGVQNDVICDGLVARIFQHEVDHLNGNLMEEKATKFQPLNELYDELNYEKFYENNKSNILEY